MCFRQPTVQRTVTPITSLQNPKVKAARALHRRRQREREGKILLEGVRLIADAVDAGYVPELLFYTESALENEQAAALVESLQEVAWAVTDEIMAHLADTVTPQGLVAVVPRPALPWPPAVTLLLLCDGVRDPGNMGTLIRAAAGAGVDGIVVPRGNVDVWSPKVLRAAMGAHFHVPLRAGVEWAEVPALLTGLRVRLAEARAATRYFEVDWSLPSALIVGGEASGVGETSARLAQERISIPLARDIESLNVGVAAAVILFEARRQRLERTAHEHS